MTTTHSHPDRSAIMQWSDQELDAPAAALVRTHLETCTSCAGIADELRDVRSRANRWSVEPAPPRVRAVVLASARTHHRASRRPEAAPSQIGFSHRYRWQSVAAAAVVMIAIGLATQWTLCGSAICYAKGSHPAPPLVPAPSDDFEKNWQSRGRVDLGIPQGSAAVVVAWFVDYECPACRSADSAYTTLVEQYVSANPGQVQLVVRDFPWNTDCNPSVRQTFPGHEASCAAAVAMHLASERGTADALKDWLFGHQGGTTIGEVRDAAVSVAGITDFDTRYPVELARLRSLLGALGPTAVTATPSCFVNGIPAMQSDNRVFSLQDLRRAIEFELKRKREGKR